MRVTAWKSSVWTLRMLAMAMLGMLWLMGPSISVYHVGHFLAPGMGWTPEMIHMASTNAFLIWTATHVLFFLFDRYMTHKIQDGIEQYHIEYIELKKRLLRKTGAAGDLETIRSIRKKLNAGS